MSIQNIQTLQSAVPQVHWPQEGNTKQFFPALDAEQKTKAVQLSAVSSGDVLSQDEKQFFEELFPSAAQQIREYHAYGRDGSRQAVSTGTVVDRRG
jgi:hypothetical protein